MNKLDFDNVDIDNSNSGDSVVIIEGPNSKRTLFFTISFLFILLLVFILYLFLPNSKYTQVVNINTGETRIIDVNNINKGNLILRLYSQKSNNILNTNKIYFGQFKINMSIKYFFDNRSTSEILYKNVLIEPTFELDENVSYPVTIYENQIPKHVISASFIIATERVLIQNIALEFAFDNSIHHLIDITWEILGSIIVFLLLFQYYIIIRKERVNRIEQKITFIYLIVLCFDSLPISILVSHVPFLQNFQKSLLNSVFLCTFLIFFKTIKMRGKSFSLIPFVLFSMFLLIMDIIDTEFSLYHVDALVGIIYLALFLFEFIGAIGNHDETETFKLFIFSVIFITIPSLLLLSRIITRWCKFASLKHLNHIFPCFVRIIYASLIAYLFCPINPTDEVEYMKVPR